MDNLYISVFLITFLTCASFGQDNYEVTFQNEPKMDVSEGAELIALSCEVTGDGLNVLQHMVDFYYVNPVSKTETLMSQNGALDEEAQPSFYSVKASAQGDITKKFPVAFTILKVRYRDDGFFECRYRDKKASVEIVVHRPLDTLQLKFGDEDPISKKPSDPLEIDAGKYTVSCIGEGSNPAVKEIHLFFNGVMVDHGEPTVTQMESTERKFTSTISAEVDIMVKDSDKEFDCQAKDSEGLVYSTKLGIFVNIYDPVVSCNASSAYEGQDNPILSCTVNHTNLEVTGYGFEIGETGEIIKEGDQHNENIEVIVSNVAPGITIVSLDLHKAKKEYLDKDYYVLIDIKGGHTSKESVRLHSVEVPGGIDEIGQGNGPSDDGSRTSSSFVCVAMCLMMFWLR